MLLTPVLRASVLSVLLAAGVARAETLVVGIASDPTGFDPEAVLNNTSGFIMSAVFDSLVKYKPGTSEVAPGVSDHWDISADGLTYVFHIRPGIKFHDGTALDAHAVFWNVDRLLNKAHPEYIYNTGPVEGYITSTYGAVQSYRALDDSRFELVLKQPFAPLLSSLAMVWNGLVSPASAAKYGKDLRNHPVGSGPFVFREWRQRDQIALDANPGYWNGAPKVERLVFKEYPDPQAALLALKRGEMQILGDLSVPSIPAIESDPALVLVTQPGLAVSGVGFPNEVAPFTDKRVRQALNYAVDKNAINKALFRGLAAPMTSPLPEAEWGFDKSLPGYGYDPEKARALLKEAGVPADFKVELLTYNSPRGYNPAGASLAVAIQGYLSKVGVTAEVRQMEFGAFLSTIRSGTYKGMFLTGFTGNSGDPDDFMAGHWGSAAIPIGNQSHYRSAAFDALLAEGVRVTDQAGRVAVYKKIQPLMMEDAPWLFVNTVLQVRAIRKEVKGFLLNPTQMFFDMEGVSIQR